MRTPRCDTYTSLLSPSPHMYARKQIQPQGEARSGVLAEWKQTGPAFCPTRLRLFPATGVVTGTPALLPPQHHLPGTIYTSSPFPIHSHCPLINHIPSTLHCNVKSLNICYFSYVVVLNYNRLPVVNLFIDNKQTNKQTNNCFPLLIYRR